jgi:hypothetical protein
MVISFQTSNKIEFPVYKLPHSNWELIDGLLFMEGKILDDRNMPGSSLGLRRVQTPHKSLLKLNKQLLNLSGMLKQSKMCFIDSKGMPFIYEKSLMCKLSYHKIKRIDRKETYCLLWVKGINFPFTIPRPPEAGMLWAGILHFHGLPWILYEYSETKLKDTRRKV